EQAIDDRVERGRVAHHFRVDPGQPGDELRNRDARIDERVEGDGAVEHDDGDFHDAVTAKGADAGGFDVDNRPPAGFEDRTGTAGRRGHRPPAVGGTSEAWIGRE